MGPLRSVEALAEDHNVLAFQSGVDALDKWLRQSARTAAAAGTAATYVLCRGELVIGHYALAMSSVSHVHAPQRLRRGMPNPVPVVLLARLALDRRCQGQGLGGEMLMDAERRCVRGSREFGARAVVVDAIDPAAVAFYRHFGFLDLEGQRLWRRISSIERDLSSIEMP